jgi:hypothetical protein
MKLQPYQIWFNVIKDNVEQVEMIIASDRAEAFDIINDLLTQGIKMVKLRDNWGRWSEHKMGGANE